MKIAKHTTESFVTKASIMVEHKNIDYTNFDINEKDEKGRCKFVCKIHGEFWQTPHDHLSGCTCKECAKEFRAEKKRKPFEQMVKEAKAIHGDDYEYFEFFKDGTRNYKGANYPMQVWCTIHKKFFPIRPANLINQKQGCPDCRTNKISKSKTKTQKQFESDVYERWGDKYDLSKAVYRGNKIKVILICHEIDPITGKEHGEFPVRPNDLLSTRGSGCPICGKKHQAEDRLYDNISEIYTDAIHSFHSTWLGKQEIDIFIPSLNVGIEYQGAQHFIPKDHFGGQKGYEKTVERDKRKYDLCNKNNIALLYYTEEKEHPEPNNYIGYLYLDYNELLEKIKSYG